MVLWWHIFKTHQVYLGAPQLALVVKNPPANAGDERHGFNHWVGKIPWRKAWQPTPVRLPGESHGQRGLVGCSCKESNTTSDWARKKTSISRINTGILEMISFFMAHWNLRNIVLIQGNDSNWSCWRWGRMIKWDRSVGEVFWNSPWK